MTPPIDLRSDTVTRPDDAMRQAMASAEVGDDVYGEDPTVRRLEALGAEAVGQEAGLFVPSGTMGNQIALRVHARPGEEVLCDSDSHIARYELGAMAALSGLVLKVVPLGAARTDLEAVNEALCPGTDHEPRSGVLSLENTHNVSGGRVFELATLDQLVALAGRQRLPLHLDGARIFNAAAALGVSAQRLASGCDSVMFCLSKGLGAPVGSLLCGPASWIAEARRVRKMFGGGMRQAGVLAAAGLVALEHGPRRLEEDHRNAALLAAGLAQLPGLLLDPAAVQTNIVVVGIDPAELAEPGEPRALRDELLRRAALGGVRASPWLKSKVRFVTHRDVSRDDVLSAVAAVSSALDTIRRQPSAAPP